MKRRNFLRAAVIGAGVTAFGNTLTPSAMAAPAQNGPSPYGAPQAADANGIRLPAGSTSRTTPTNWPTTTRSSPPARPR